MSVGQAQRTAARRERTARALRWLEDHALLVAACALMSAFFLGQSPRHLNQDGWLALVAGREIAENGIPDVDTWTIWSSGARWIDQQWLAQLVMFEVQDVRGVAGVVVLHVALAMTAFALALAGAHALGAVASHVIWVLPVSGFLYLVIAAQVRTQAFAFVLFVVVLVLLTTDARRARRRTLWVFPLLLLWANLHGAVVIGVGLTGLYGLMTGVEALRSPARPRAALARATAFCIVPILTLLATPYGVRGLEYYVGTIFDSRFRGVIAEWQPVTTDLVLAVPFFALMFWSLWAIGRSHGRTPSFDRVALVVLAAAGVLAVRNVAWFALAAIVLVPPMLTAGLGAPTGVPVRRGTNRVLVGISLLVLIVTVPVVAAKPDRWFEKGYDQRALAPIAAAVDEDASLRVFAQGRFADWLLWRLPRLEGRIAFDARLELLTDERLEQLSDLGLVRRDWPAALRGFGLLVLEPRDRPDETRAVLRLPGVRVLHRSDDIVVARATATSARRGPAGR